MSSTLCLNDDTFGPSVQGCRGDFDFTQKFERIFFSILPASVFIALATARVAVLAQRKTIVRGAWFQWVKLGFIAAYAALQLSLLILLAKGPPGSVHRLSLAGTTLVFVASLFTLPLSYAEHGRARRPSSLLAAYLLLTVLFDIVQVRTAWLSIFHATQTTQVRIFTATLALKAVILCIETVSKSRWIMWNAEEHSPEESSGILSLGVFWWLNRLFMTGYSGVLNIDDLYPLDTGMAADLLHEKFSAKLKQETLRKHSRVGLLREIFKILPGAILIPVAPRIANTGFKFCQPFFINAALSYLETPFEDRTKNFGYGLIGACVIIYLGLAVSWGFYGYYRQRAVFTIRGILVSAIYTKTTEVRVTDSDDSAALTLMSSDIERIIQGGQSFHEVWVAVIEFALGSWLLYDQLGLAFLAPIVVILVCVVGLSMILRFVGKKQAQWMSRIQLRVGLTANAISNMKLYKISGITGPVSSLIQSLRLKELQIGNQWRWLLISAALLAFVPSTLGPVFTFAVSAQSLGITRVFTSLSYIMLVTSPLVEVFQLLPTILAAGTCLQRIQKYLLNKPRQDFRTSDGDDAQSFDETEKKPIISTAYAQTAFEVQNGSFGWGGDKMTLNNINVKIPAKALTLIIGPVASGKSTFCKVLLGEIPTYSGRVSFNVCRSNLAYCEQTPFLYNATLQENVVGHSPFDQTRYDQVIHATLLDVDAEVLPDGHDTKIGSGGIMLSGGQKQRVSVARALYSGAQVMLFDDVLSGLDTDTEAELFRRVFGPEGLISRWGVTAIVCTHSVRHLPSADHIVALDTNGTVVEEGPFEALMKNDGYVHSLGVKSSSEVSSIQEPESLPLAVAAPAFKPRSDAIKSSLGDSARMNGDWTVYLHYFRNVSTTSLVSCVFFAITFGFANNFSSIWLNYYAADTFHRSDAFYIGIYGLLKGSMVLSLLGLGTACMIAMVMYGGTALHRQAITTVITAPLRFFTTTDTGIVVNLFSQDMSLIDMELPNAVLNVTLAVVEVIGGAVVIASSSPLLAVSYPVLAAILYLVQKFYLRTSRQLRILELEAKSPLYTHFTDTITGVATIRAFGWQHKDVEKHYRLLDRSQRPAYLLSIIQQWLATMMQILVGVLAIGIIAFATQRRVSAGLTGAGLVTLLQFGDVVTALIRAYTLLETSIGAVNRLRTFSQVVKPEDQDGEDLKPPVEWPQHGRIDIRGVSASYESDTETEGSGPSTPSKLVVNNLDLHIQTGEKVAICGRTGSGKSTLILLLLRLLDPLSSCSQNITIDGMPYHKIDRSTLRKRIIAIPQDATFLPDGSTIKANLDPFEEGTDEEALSVLGTIGLKGFLDDKGGLAANMSADDLSAGQKQLFSLGRAILRKRVRDRLVSGIVVPNSSSEKGHGGVLLLDEVSSSVDIVTDRLMQEIIRQEFRQYTILMVSHRLEMVRDFFDTVVVLDKGRVIEKGEPRQLIEREGSRFGELWALGNHENT